MAFDRKILVIPDKTKFEEQRIFTRGDVVIGDRSLFQFSINTDGRIFIGEHVITSGNLNAENDIRIDIFSAIGGDISSGANVYLGEKVKVKGKLSLKGDLDVGDSVEIDSGFEAKGWINIRSPIPTVIYIFIYLLQLLKMGHSEEIERLLEELEENDGKTIPISESFLFIPTNSIIGLSKSKVDYSLRIGKDCKIIGNYDIKGNIFVDDHSEIFGSLTAISDVYCGKNVKVHGNITCKGLVNVADKTQILGNVSADEAILSKSSTIQGTLLAPKGVSFVDLSTDKATERVKRFENNADIVDEVKEMLE
ncbi:MAG: polymer-forming cytoskeletal protein [Thermoplasmatota archaeon]